MASKSSAIITSSASAVEAGVRRRTRTATTTGTSAAERRIRKLQQVAETVNTQTYVMMVYDIPTSKNDDCQNPSATLWHHGFRINLSCWVLPTKELDAPRVKDLLNLWEEHGIRVHVVEYAESQHAKIRIIARENLEAEIRRVHTSLIESIGNADDQLKAAREEVEKAADLQSHGKTEEQAQSYRDSRVRAALSQASGRLEAAISCAEAFDVSEDVEAVLAGLKEALAARKGAFEAAMEARGISSDLTIRRTEAARKAVATRKARLAQAG